MEKNVFYPERLSVVMGNKDLKLVLEFRTGLTDD